MEREARQTLGNKVFGKSVRVDWKKRDRYGRIMGRVYLGDHDISLEMLRQGWAWHSFSPEFEERMVKGTRSSASQKVLFIGNSFTARNDLPGLVTQLATTRGISLQHRLISAGAPSRRPHWNAGLALRAIQANP